MKMKITLLLSLTLIILTASGCAWFKPSRNKEKPSQVLQEKSVRSPAGGFEFQPLQGYSTTETAGSASMFLPGGDQQSGPGMLLSGLTFDQPVSLEQAEAVILKTYPAYTFDKSRPIHVDKVKGTVMEFSTVYHALDGITLDKPGADEGEEILGRVIVVMVSPTHQFRCILLAPADQWKDVRRAFDSVLKSVHFFTP